MFILHNQNPFFGDYQQSLESIIHLLIDQDRIGAITIVVPTGRRVRSLRRTIIQQYFHHYGKPTPRLNILTLEGLIQRTAEILYGNDLPRLISEGYSVALMEEAAHEAAQNKQLQFFTGNQEDLSVVIVQRLYDIITGLKEDGITSEALRQDLESGSPEIVDKQRLQDIATLYEWHETLLGENLCDMPGLLRRLNQRLQSFLSAGVVLDSAGDGNKLTEVWKEIFRGQECLIIEGFTEFKKPEEEFLGLLFYAPLHVRIIIDYSPVNGPLFGTLQQTVETLQGISHPIGEQTAHLPHYQVFSLDTHYNGQFEHNPHDHQPLTSYIRRWLFNTSQDIRHDGFNDFTTILAFNSRTDEARGITKIIKHLILRENIPPAEICIVMRQPEHYTDLFREMFDRYHVPVNITDRFVLSRSPVITAIFALLDMVLFGYKQNDVLRAVQSPFLRFEREKDGKRLPIDTDNLIKTAMRLRINGGNRFYQKGKDIWLQRMQKNRELLVLKKEHLSGEKFVDNDEVKETENHLEETTRAIDDFTYLCALLPEPTKTFTPSGFRDMIENVFLNILAIPECIMSWYQRISDMDYEIRYTQAQLPRNPVFQKIHLEEEVEKDTRAISTFLALLAETTSIMEERFGKKRRSFADYCERLRTATRSTRYQLREKFGYGVTITSLEQIRAIPYRVTVLCGAIDGEFPIKYTPSTFLGKDLPDSEDRSLQSERLQFFQIITNGLHHHQGIKKLLISYPTRSGEVELIRSSFVDAFLKVTSLQQNQCLWTIQDSKVTGITEAGQAPDWISSAVTIASEDELLRSAGMAIKQGIEKQSIMLSAFEAVEQSMTKLSQSNVFLPFAAENLIHIFYVIQRTKWYKPQEELIVTPSVTPVSEMPRFSISALEQYKECPYQYFAQRTLRLQALQQYDTYLSPLESGSLTHRILYRFYMELQKRESRQGEEIFEIPALISGLPPIRLIRLNPSNAFQYNEELSTIAEREIEQIRFEHPFFQLDKEELTGNKEKKGKLLLWLEKELERVAAGWAFMPGLFELSFGERGGESGVQIDSVQVGENFQLRGKIDRLELFHNEDKEIRFLIADYKTGSLQNLPGNTDIKKGESLQMPLYATVAKTILKTYYGIDAEPEGMVYYVLSPQKNNDNVITTTKFVLLPDSSSLSGIVGLNTQNRGQIVRDPEEMQKIVDRTIEFSVQYADEIQRGNFPVRPNKKEVSCNNCSYRAMCRIGDIA